MLDGADTPSTCSSLLSRRQYNDNVVDTGRSLCHVTVSYGATDVCEDAKLSLDRGSAASVSTVGEGQMDDATVVQAGVQGIEAVGKAWTKTSLGVAYAGLYLLAFVTSLESQTTTNLAVFATSAFGAQAMIATVLVVQGTLNSVVKPPMAKVADVFGRAESFSFSILLYVLGNIQQAASHNIETYASAQIFHSAGSTGLQILQQIFIADTSSLLNRALFSTFPDLPFLITTWIGSPIAEKIVRGPGWRWGYGVWAVMLPVSFLPLGLSLFLNKRKARMMGVYPNSQFAGTSWRETAAHLWFELDFFGLLLLAAGVALLLIPLTLGATAVGGWQNPSIVVMLMAGVACLCVFPLWEGDARLAPKAFFPKALFRNRTVIAGVTVAFFYFVAYYMTVEPYFYSYLLVVQNQSITAAGHITLTFTFTSTVTAVCVSFAIKFSGRYKHFVTIGACIYMLGICLMIKYRSIGTSVASLVGSQVLVGIGGGMLNVPAQLGVQASASHAEVAAATAIFLTILEIGGAVGSALSGAIWSSLVPKKLALYLPAEAKDQAAAIYGSITAAANTYPVGSATRDAINRAYQESMTTILMVGVYMCVPVIVASLFMENYDLKEIDQEATARIAVGDETAKLNLDSAATDFKTNF